MDISYQESCFSSVQGTRFKVSFSRLDEILEGISIEDRLLPRTRRREGGPDRFAVGAVGPEAGAGSPDPQRVIVKITILDFSKAPRRGSRFSGPVVGVQFCRLLQVGVDHLHMCCLFVARFFGAVVRVYSLQETPPKSGIGSPA